MWKPSSVAEGGSEVHLNSRDGVEILIFLNCFSAGASPILTNLGYIKGLGATERPVVLRCCAEGGLSRPKLRKLLIMKLCCSAVDECFKKDRKRSRNKFFRNVHKKKYYTKDRSVLEDR